MSLEGVLCRNCLLLYCKYFLVDESARHHCRHYDGVCSDGLLPLRLLLSAVLVQGEVSVTQTGVRCQSWGVDVPHQRHSVVIDELNSV